LQTESLKPAPARGLRPGALLVSGLISAGGAALVLFAIPGGASDARVAAAWVLIQFIAGVWAGVLGANSPFLHGLAAAAPAMVLGLLCRGVLPAQFVAVSAAIAPAAALIAAAIMRFMRRRE
jgi:hypothetical protein